MSNELDGKVATVTGGANGIGRAIVEVFVEDHPPADEPTLTAWQKVASRLNHWGLYILLLCVPIAGYIGISLYPALDILGLFSLPAVVEPNREASATAFLVHRLLGRLLVLLIAIHVAAALFHYFIRKDNVLARMLPRLLRR